MQVTQCGVHGYHETLGIDEDQIYVFWKLASKDLQARQTAYRVILSYHDQQAGPSVAWDSGKVQSEQQRNVLCKPDNGFRSTCTYKWVVTVWDAQDQAFSSAENDFFTAYPHSRKLPPWSMNQTYMPHSSFIFRTWFEDEANRWKGVWVGDGTDKPFYARKNISLSKKPSRAVVFASGLGHFNLSVNGTPASAHVLDPGWTDYHKTVQFVSYDVTDKLTAGENAIGAHIGNGFYAGDQADRFFWPLYEDKMYVRFGNELCFFCEIHLIYEDGSHQTIISDPDWKVRSSATLLANIYGSETHDRRLLPAGWDTPSFDDSQWSTAKPLTGPKGELRYQSQPPIVAHQTFEPVAVNTIKPGVVVYDLGQNASTMVKISVSGAAGSEVIIRPMETVDENGAVVMPDPLFKEFETHVYNKFILAGTGEAEEWQPDFSFTSARYIQIEGVALPLDQNSSSLPVVHSAVGQHVSSASRRLGKVSTDKEDVNALINACFWTYSSNLLSWHTDCPQIEKFPWLEVTHLLFPSSQYVFDIEALHSKILRDIVDAQEKSGFVPNMSPEMRYMCGPMRDTITWGCAICFIPEMLKRYYGSTQMIAACYKAAKAYIDHMRTKERKGGLIEHGLGDWGRDIAFGNYQTNIESAVYHKCLKNCEMMAEELGYKNEAQDFRATAEKVFDLYNKTLLKPRDESAGHPTAFYTSLDEPGKLDKTAINQAVALQFGMVPESHIEDIQQTFLADVADCRIRAGEIGLPYLFATLADLRRPDIVLAMARQEEHPSYMRFLRRGETTLLEFWQDECRSKCHDMLGTIYEWFYRAVLGLKLTSDAYKTFEVFPPYESEFGRVEGSVESPYGKIAVEFERRGEGESVVAVTVPMSTTCTLKVPKGAKVEVSRYGQVTSAPQDKAGSLELRHGQYSVQIRQGGSIFS